MHTAHQDTMPHATRHVAWRPKHGPKSAPQTHTPQHKHICWQRTAQCVRMKHRKKASKIPPLVWEKISGTAGGCSLVHRLVDSPPCAHLRTVGGSARMSAQAHGGTVTQQRAFAAHARAEWWIGWWPLFTGCIIDPRNAFDPSLHPAGAIVAAGA